MEQAVEELTPVIGTRPACRALGVAVATIYRRRELGRDQPRFVSLFDESSAQMMGAAARLHADQTRLELGGESEQLRAAQAPAQNDLAGPIESDKVKYGLRYIDAYRRYRHEWSSFRLKPATPVSSPRGGPSH
jgi:hypothetical protein